MIYILLILLLATSGFGAVREKSVFGFKGGLVNSVSNSLMEDNMALVLENYDITDVGTLKRRPGMIRHYVKGISEQQAFFTRQVDNAKEMLIMRIDSSHFKGAGGSLSDTISNNVFVMALCDNAGLDCSTFVSVGFYSHRRNVDRPFSVNSTTWINNLFIASQKSELMFWDGTDLSPSRPLAPGQPQVFALDGGGNVTGRYTYKVAFANTGAISAGTDTSLFSPPSWQVDVTNGKVAVILPLPLATNGLAIIYRKHVDSSLYGFVATHSISSGDSLLYLDNTASTSVNGFYLFGPRQSENGVWRTVYDSLETELKPVAPGGFNIGITKFDGTSGHQGIVKPIVADSLTNATVYYQVVYKDSSGREAYGTPICAYSWDSSAVFPSDMYSDRSVHMTLTNIPVGGSNIVSKELRRRVNANFRNLTSGTGGADSVLGDGWRVIATLDKDSTTYTDSTKVNNQDGTGVEPGDTVFVLASDSAWSLGPEAMEYDDSNIVFQPTDLIVFGQRGFSIGNPNFKNRLYYSQFGRLTTWASDNFHNLFSNSGDWLVGLASLGGRMLAFRQNSVMQLTGLTFYQFDIQEVIADAGLTGRRTLVTGLNDVFFAHTTGLYQFSRFGGISKIPISLPIQNTVDSAKTRIQRSVGHLIEGEYWWSLSVDTNATGEETGNTRTYIYAQYPVPHWKEYSFAVNAMAPYNFDTTASDFETHKFIMIRSDDSLYRWGYEDTSTTDANANFTAHYQSKYYFEAPGRERIHYIDFYGSGSATDMVIVFYKNYGEGIAGVPFDSVTFSPNFDDGKRDRVKVDAVVENFSIRIHDNGTGGYQLRGYNIGWQQWDRGKI